MKSETSVMVRVRYCECDGLRVAHHSVYPVWMEIARTELLREQGMAYRDLEEAGVGFVVASMSVRYRKPARYDDVLEVKARALPAKGIKIEHEYEIRRGEELLATAETTLVCVDGNLKPRLLPEGLAARSDQ